MSLTKHKNEKVAIIGSGLIGKSWAMLFASAGYEVSIYDVDKAQQERALTDIKFQLGDMKSKGFLHGSLTPDQILDLITFHGDLKVCVKGARHVQECTPENIDLKLKVFKELDELATDGMILASSSSAMPVSTFTSDLQHRSHTLICHPVNPPYHMPTVEVVPAPYTDPNVVKTSMDLMTSIGQSPVLIKKEVPAFVQPRVQYAVIQECWKMVLEGVISAHDVDKIMTDGLGMRYAFMGPFETVHLNGEGVKSYMDRYADMIHRISNMSGPAKPMTGGAAEAVFQEMNQWSQIEKLDEKRKWRDQGIAMLSNIRREMNEQDS